MITEYEINYKSYSADGYEFTVVKYIEIKRLRELHKAFKMPIGLYYRYDAGNKLHIFENSKLQIICSHRKYKECLKEVREELSVLWNEIALADDCRLAPDALKMKQYLLSFKK